MNSRVLVIAEAGVNHDGDLAKALNLVDAAVAAGADIVKFQTFSVDEITTSSAPLAPYQERQLEAASSQASMLSKLVLRESDWQRLVNHCRSKQIEFLSTGFDQRNISMLLGLGMKRIKIPSGEITNLPLLRYIASIQLPIIMSTGMATLEEVWAAVEVLTAHNLDSPCIDLLHCTSQYPAPPETVNLRAMLTMRDELRLPVGYSDHTLGWEVAVAAVALGASIIEKHITLDSTAPGPDQSASLEPDQFAEMVRAIRLTESALGHGSKVPNPVEEGVRAIARRSIVATRHISRGQVILEDDLAAKRPATGLSPMLWETVVGSRSIKDYRPDDYIEL